MTAMKVYIWSGQHYSPQYAGGWVLVTWAAAVSSRDELRRVCSDQRVKYPRKPYQVKPGRDEWEAAMARPGMLVFRNDEPRGDETGDWQTLPAEG
jgi:hypothetical protein